MYQGPGIYRSIDYSQFAYIVPISADSMLFHVYILQNRKRHKVSLFMLETMGYAFHIPAEGRSLEQLLHAHPELLL